MNEPAAPRRRGCLGTLLRGCLGCAGILVVLAIVLAALALIKRPGPPDPGTRTAEPQAALTGRGRIVLEMEAGAFRIEPAEAGTAPRVVASMDDATHQLEQIHSTGGDGWEWHVRFGLRTGVIGTLLAGKREPATVVVSLPKDLPLDLEVRARRGNSDIELGGLALERVDLRLSTGNHRVTFSEPTRDPLSSLVVHASTGNTVISRIGQASPALTSLTLRAGDLAADLSGAWRAPATVDVNFRMGGVVLTAPDSVRLARGRTDVSAASAEFPPMPAATDEPAGPEVRLDVEGRFGNVRLERRTPAR